MGAKQKSAAVSSIATYEYCSELREKLSSKLEVCVNYGRPANFEYISIHWEDARRRFAVFVETARIGVVECRERRGQFRFSTGYSDTKWFDFSNPKAFDLVESHLKKQLDVPFRRRK